MTALDARVTTLPPPPRPADGRSPAPRTAPHQPATPNAAAAITLAIVCWGLVVALSRVWGLLLIEQGVRIVLYAPPLLGGYRPSPPPTWWLGVVVGTGLALTLPRLVERARWVAVVWSTTVAAGAWWLALALADGRDGLVHGLAYDVDYRQAAGEVAGDPLAFLRSYVHGLADRPIALRGHPPGFALLFGALERIGLGGEAAAVIVVLFGSLLAIPAVLVTVRVVAGERWARRGAPFVALAPSALWIATSTDGLSMGTSAIVIALLAVAGARPTFDRAALALAMVAGFVGAMLALQSYGGVLMVVPAGAVAWRQRRAGPLVVAALTTLVLVASLALVGFWWPSGLAATAHEYHTLDLQRPYAYFLIANLGAWALATGPATAGGLARLRDRRLWILVGGALGAAVLADLSGLSEGEVERIWLPFTIWVLPAGAALWGTRWAARAWLLAQVATALIITALIRTAW